MSPMGIWGKSVLAQGLSKTQGRSMCGVVRESRKPRRLEWGEHMGRLWEMKSVRWGPLQIEGKVLSRGVT